MHAVWKFLLNDNFIHMHIYGMVVQCHDGVEWHIYLRIFTYSADYPEKWALWFHATLWLIIFRVLLATIRDQGLCLCPCCLVPDTKLDQLGLIADMKTRIKKYHIYPTNSVKKAWNAIYNFGDSVNGTTVQRLLKATSNVPTSVSHRSFHLKHKVVVKD